LAFVGCLDRTRVHLHAALVAATTANVPCSNAGVGPGIAALDVSMAKQFRVTERVRVDFRSEFFNVPNHPIFGQPGATVGTVTNGVIGSTRLDSRQIQFGLKLSF